MREWLSGRASPCQGERREFESRLPLHDQETQIASLDLPKISIRNIYFNIRILNIYVRRHGQVVRHRSATPLFPSSNLGGASRKKHFVRSAFFNDVCLRQMMTLTLMMFPSEMMSASPNVICKHRIIASKTSNIILRKAKNIISLQAMLHWKYRILWYN